MSEFFGGKGKEVKKVSYCQVLSWRVEGEGQGQPRYDFISDPDGGEVAYVSL